MPGRRVDGHSGRFIHNQIILVLIKDGKRARYRLIENIFRRQAQFQYSPRWERVHAAARLPIQLQTAFQPFQLRQCPGGKAQLAPKEILHRAALPLRGNGRGKGPAHLSRVARDSASSFRKRVSPWKPSKAFKACAV